MSGLAADLTILKDGKLAVVICSDLASRGIDVDGVSHVINFELPSKKENYIHRIGRSGRFGRRGIAINLISDHEANLLLDIRDFYHTQIPPLPTDLAEIE